MPTLALQCAVIGKQDTRCRPRAHHVQIYPADVSRQRCSLAFAAIQYNAVQMSERLQDLERAVTSGTAVDGDGSTTSKRSLSVSMTRKPSLIIRRTLSSFR